MAGPMFRRAAEPALRIGQRCVILNGSAFQVEDKSVVFEVTGEQVVGQLGQSGLLGLATVAAAAQAGYAFDKNATIDQAIAVGPNPAIQPQSLQAQRYQLCQARFKTKYLNMPAPPTARDLDVWVNNPSNSRVISGTATGMVGVINAIDQFPDPIDTAALAAQGGALAYPTLYPNDGEWERAAFTEQWWYYNNAPAFQLVNNGSVAIAAGGTFAWFLKVWLVVYNIAPLISGTMRTEILGGQKIEVPASISRQELLDGLVQTQAQNPSGTAITV